MKQDLFKDLILRQAASTELIGSYSSGEYKSIIANRRAFERIPISARNIDNFIRIKLLERHFN